MSKAKLKEEDNQEAIETSYDPTKENMEVGDILELRITPEGKITKGHWKSRARLIASGEGFKFTIKCSQGMMVQKEDGTTSFIENEDGTIGYLLKNLDYGWKKVTPILDERHKAYDTRIQNAHGYDFENILYPTIENAINASVGWLKSMEENRKANKKNN